MFAKIIGKVKNNKGKIFVVLLVSVGGYFVVKNVNLSSLRNFPVLYHAGLLADNFSASYSLADNTKGEFPQSLMNFPLAFSRNMFSNTISAGFAQSFLRLHA